MKAIQRFVCGLVVLGISLTLFSQIYLPLPFAGYEDLKADAAEYGWNIMDVVVDENAGIIVIYYKYEKDEFAGDDTRYMKGLDVVAEWASHQGFLRGILMISLYVEEGYTVDMKPSAHLRMGYAFLWSANALEYYLANASKFESFFHVMLFSNSLRMFREGEASFIDSVWIPHPYGLWGSLSREYKRDWGHLR